MSKTFPLQRSLPLYISAPQECEYLSDQEARSIFIAPEVEMNAELYAYLLSVGFRRSGKFVYKPRCEACQACIPCRLPVQCFKISRSQKRVLSKNTDVTVESICATFKEEHFQLYLKYQKHKHPGGNMQTFDEAAYKDFLCESFGDSVFLETRKDGRLLAVALTDVFPEALSAVYTFFDPDYVQRSLGSFSILKQIELAKQLGKEHLYMGYYIKDCQKMSYKSNFKPIEYYRSDEWVLEATVR
jgi:arginine-tRNA-protein transferase